MEKITSRNPATNQILKEFEQTPIEAIPEMIRTAREAQKYWAALPPKNRQKFFWNAREYILDHIDEIAELISKENGKPKAEAMIHDILPALELLTNFTKKAPSLLRDKQISLRVLKHRKSYLNLWPVGVVAIIAPWNFPFSIPFGEIVMALLAGNAVVFKPSEVTSLIGSKISEIFEQACFPKNLFQTIIGDGNRGAALVKGPVDKIFFTGSVATGKRVMAMAAETLTPVVLELGGKDPLIVLADADLDFATSAALWGSFANSGQVCASIERIIVHESIHDRFVDLLKQKTQTLKTLDEAGAGDLGYITFEKQKNIYEQQLSELNPTNSKIITGGQFSKNRTILQPTIVTNPDNIQDTKSCPIEKTKVYRDETFGPIVAVTKFRTIQEAIDKANDTEYGLLASIITKDAALAEQIAKQIYAGSILINEVLYTHGLSETPWGGVKNSGFGRAHSDLGFYEFVNFRHIHKERASFLVFKSLWWYPYSTHQMLMFKFAIETLFRRSFLRKLKAIPQFLVELVETLKKEPRL